MLTRLSRILMNEADASPGNGAPVAPAAPTEPPASPAAALDVDSLMTRLSGVIDEKLNAQRNGIFADLRKAGALKQEKITEITPAQPTPSAPVVAQAGLSMADVEAMLQRDRVITRAATEHKLTDAQVKRMNSALKADSPDDISKWTETYLADMGLVKAPTPAPVAAPAQAPAQAKPNISDRGAAAPTDTRDFEGVLNSRPLEMTAHDVDALILKHGETKGLQMFQDRVNAALRTVKIRPR